MWPNELLPGLKVLTVQLLAVLELLYLPLVELTQLVHQLLDQPVDTTHGLKKVVGSNPGPFKRTFLYCKLFIQSELIEPVSPQAAQLGIHFFLSQHTVSAAPP